MGRFPVALVVDDRPESLSDLELWVSMADIPDIVTATDLESAREAINRRAFDLAVVDLSLVPDDTSDRGGWKVGAMIRESEDQTATMIITGWGSEEVANETHAIHGFDFYLSRKGADLSRRIEEWINRFARNKPARTHRREDYLTRVVEHSCPPRIRGDRPYSFTDWLVDLQGVFGPVIPGETYTILGHALRGYLPICHRRTGDGVFLDSRQGLLVVNCWSRGVGKPMMFIIASEESLPGVLNELEVSKKVRGVPARLIRGPVLLGQKWHYLWAEAYKQDRLEFDPVVDSLFA